MVDSRGVRAGRGRGGRRRCSINIEFAEERKHDELDRIGDGSGLDFDFDFLFHIVTSTSRFGN
jgi:hypothetical protein